MTDKQLNARFAACRTKREAIKELLAAIANRGEYEQSIGYLRVRWPGLWDEKDEAYAARHHYPWDTAPEAYRDGYRRPPSK